jgi:hypothetical protein
MFFFLAAYNSSTNKIFIDSFGKNPSLKTDLEDLSEDIKFQTGSKEDKIACIEFSSYAPLNEKFLTELLKMSHVIVYERKYNFSNHKKYFCIGAHYIAENITAGELAILYNTIVTITNTGSVEASESQAFQLDSVNGNVVIKKTRILVTPTEARILDCLRRARGSYVPRVNIMDFCNFSQEMDERTIDSHIKRIRKKISEFGFPADIISTSYGLGYRLDLEVLKN